MKMDVLHQLSGADSFSRADFSHVYQAANKAATDAACRFALQKLLDNGDITRVGRNKYCVFSKVRKTYSHSYSDLAKAVASQILLSYPTLDYRIFELTQLNESVNHQIARNTLFVYVEADLGAYVFDALKEVYPGKVLLEPTVEMYHQYWTDDMIVIRKLITEAPKGHGLFWHTDLEKMLVDLVSDKLLLSCVSHNEYKTIFAQAFQDYCIDERQLFRYARRRNAKGKILELIDPSLLRTE